MKQDVMPRSSFYLGVFWFLIASYMALFAGHLFTVDHLATFRTIESIVTEGDLVIKAPTVSGALEVGDEYSQYGIGEPILAIPLYIVGSIVGRMGYPFSNYFAANYSLGYGADPRIFFVLLLNPLLTVLTCLGLLALLAELGYSRKTSLAFGLIYGLATIATVYTRDFFQQPIIAFVYVIALNALVRYRRTAQPLWLLLMGSALGYGFITRVQTVVSWPALLGAAGYLWYQKRGSERWVKAVVMLLGPLVLAGILQAAHNYVRYDSIWNFGYFMKGDPQKFSNPLWIGLYGLLFSCSRGAFIFSPPIFAALPFWPTFLQRHKLIGTMALGVISANLVLYGSFDSWDGSWCWGSRFTMQLTPFMLLPLVMILQKPSLGQKLYVACFVGAGLFVQAMGCLVDYNAIHWKWHEMNLAPWDSYIFMPQISQIVMHYQALSSDARIDLWILDLYRRFGAGGLLLTVVPLALIMGYSLVKLSRAIRQDGGLSAAKRIGETQKGTVDDHCGE